MSDSYGFRALTIRYSLAAAILALVPGVSMAQQSSYVPRTPSATAVRTQTADQQVIQVLNRLAFGPRPGDAAAVRAMGVDRWMEQQLHPERIDDSATDTLVAGYSLLNGNQAELASRYAMAQRERRALKRQKGDTSQQSAPPTATNPGVQDTADLIALRQIQRQRTQLMGELASARIARAVTSRRQLLEVMTDFWENHFNVYARKNAIEPYYLADYDRTIREHALGKFRDLLGAVAHSPAMLVYLDNAQSRANPGEPTLARQPARGMGFTNGQRSALMGDDVIGRRRPGLDPAAAERLRALAAKRTSGLNENYGRELLELHTLGVDGGYTQQDVIAAARALTGWSVRPPMLGSGFVFRPEWHDAASKIFMGHTLAAGRGEKDGEEVLDLVASSPSTAHFIAMKLARHFVSDSPPRALVDRAARTFLATDGDIRQVVRTIVTSPEFFSEAVYHSKVKSPFEVAVSAARALDAQPDTTARTALAVAYLGQPIFGHQAPDGWPETGESWMNTGAILNRINFGMAVAADRLPGARLSNLPGEDSLVRAPRSVQVDAVVATVLEGAASPDTRRILMSGEHPLAATAARQGSLEPRERAPADVASADPGGMTGGTTGGTMSGVRGTGRGGAARAGIVGAPPQLAGFAQVVGLALGSPEFQRR